MKRTGPVGKVCACAFADSSGQNKATSADRHAANVSLQENLLQENLLISFLSLCFNFFLVISGR
jgi:hypothetical protein